jgi:hypothetical protein
MPPSLLCFSYLNWYGLSFKEIVSELAYINNMPGDNSMRMYSVP